MLHPGTAWGEDGLMAGQNNSAMANAKPLTTKHLCPLEL